MAAGVGEQDMRRQNAEDFWGGVITVMVDLSKPRECAPPRVSPVSKPWTWVVMIYVRVGLSIVTHGSLWWGMLMVGRLHVWEQGKHRK